MLVDDLENVGLMVARVDEREIAIVVAPELLDALLDGQNVVKCRANVVDHSFVDLHG